MVEDCSRRTVIGGALAGSIVMLGGCTLDGAATSASAKPTALAGADAGKTETQRWTAVTGKSFVVAGPDGTVAATLASVVPQAVVGKRPAELRQEPFNLFFALAPGQDLSGDQLYTVTSAAMSAKLFLQRGTDPLGNAVLTALLN